MISCCVNFKEKPNIPYYKLLQKQMNDAQTSERCDGVITEHAALSASGGVLSRICEGYQFIIAFEGELYKKARLVSELKSAGYCFTDESDAELALFAYIHYGEKSAAKLHGCFSYVIYDTMRGQVFAASDLFASSPLFYAKIGNTYLLASEIRGIFAHPDISARVTPEGISRALTPSAYCGGCVFDGIKMLAPVHILKIRGESAIKKPYAPEKGGTAEDEIRGGIGEVANAGAFFSGKCDERFLCGKLARVQAEKFRRTAIYSAQEKNLPEKYTAEHIRLATDTNSIYSGLRECVLAAGMPILSENDFLLACAMKQAARDGVTLMTALPGASKNFDGRGVLDGFLHRAVKETILRTNEGESLYCPAAQLAAAFGAKAKTPMLCGKVYEMTAGGKNLHAEAFEKLIKASDDAEKEKGIIYRRLQRILTDIISSGNEPISAFFDKNALLTLCERGAGLPTRTECALLAYLIKFNIWLTEFKPYLV